MKISRDMIVKLQSMVNSRGGVPDTIRIDGKNLYLGDSRLRKGDKGWYRLKTMLNKFGKSEFINV